MLGRLPDAQEPGRRWRIAVEPTGGRVFSPRSAGSPRPISRWRRLPLPLSLTCGPVETASSLARLRRFSPWAMAGPARSRPCAPLRPAGPDFAPPGPPEPKTFFFFIFHPFSPLVIYISIFYVPKIIKTLSMSHKMIILEFDTLHSVNHC
jgi:hypothetical protein